MAYNLEDYINKEAVLPDGYIVNVSFHRRYKSVGMNPKMIGLNFEVLKEKSNSENALSDYISKNTISLLGKVADRELERIPKKLKMRLTNKGRLNGNLKSYNNTASFVTNGGVFLTESETIEFIKEFEEAKLELETVIKDTANHLWKYKEDLKQTLTMQLSLLETNISQDSLEIFVEEIMKKFPEPETFKTCTKMSLIILKIVNQNSAIGEVTKESNISVLLPVFYGLFSHMQRIYDLFMKKKVIPLKAKKSLEDALKTAQARNNGVFKIIDEIFFTLGDDDTLVNECYHYGLEIYNLLAAIGESDCVELYAFDFLNDEEKIKIS